mgnify:CR=1 FL=1
MSAGKCTFEQHHVWIFKTSKKLVIISGCDHDANWLNGPSMQHWVIRHCFPHPSKVRNQLGFIFT